MTAKLKVVEMQPGGPPRPLGKHGMALWRSIMDEYAISDSGGVELLTQACQALDRLEAISELIDHAGEGSVHSETGVVRSNPLLKEELSCRAFVAKCIERLNLNSEPVKSTGRPPASWNYEKTRTA